jgi:hypothetical protein
MKRIISLSIIVNLLVSTVFVIFEPQISKAVADEIVVTAEVTEEISISSPGDVLLASSIPSMTGNPGAPASGSATWTVITANATGFNLKIKASTDPSMKNSDGEYFFHNYTPAVAASADYNWASPAVGSAEFGYSVTAATAADTDTPFLNDGSGCGGGLLNTDNQCWLNFNGVSDTTVINRNTNTTVAGEAEKVNFRAESNAAFLKEGYYDATIIVTATVN